MPIYCGAGVSRIEGGGGGGGNLFKINRRRNESEQRGPSHRKKNGGRRVWVESVKGNDVSARVGPPR